jgi:hypothetical protein
MKYMRCLDWNFPTKVLVVSFCNLKVGVVSSIAEGKDGF